MEWLDLLRKRMFYVGPDYYPDQVMRWVRKLVDMGHAHQLPDGRYGLTEDGRIYIVPQVYAEMERANPTPATEEAPDA